MRRRPTWRFVSLKVPEASTATCGRVAVGGGTWTAERRDLWRDLLPLVIALGAIDQAVRRGIGRASHPRAPLGKFPELMDAELHGQCAEPLLVRKCLNVAFSIVSVNVRKVIGSSIALPALEVQRYNFPFVVRNRVDGPISVL
jgi:hypothetical protein